MSGMYSDLLWAWQVEISWMLLLPVVHYLEWMNVFFNNKKCVTVQDELFLLLGFVSLIYWWLSWYYVFVCACVCVGRFQSYHRAVWRPFPDHFQLRASLQLHGCHHCQQTCLWQVPECGAHIWGQLRRKEGGREGGREGMGNKPVFVRFQSVVLTSGTRLWGGEGKGRDRRREEGDRMLREECSQEYR